MTTNCESDLNSKEIALGIISKIADNMVLQTEDLEMQEAIRLISSVARQGHGVISEQDQKKYNL